MSRGTTGGLDFDELPFSKGNWERLIAEYKRLKMNNEEQQIAIRLNKISEFVMMHYQLLPTTRTSIEAFNKLNDLYFDYYGTYRFSCYQSFCQNRKIYLRKKNNL